MSKAKRRLRCCGMGLLAAVLAYVLLALAGYYFWRSRNEPTFSRAAAIKRGMPEAEVLERLGDPWHVYEAGTAPEDYYVEGYEHRKRPISDRVLIYVYGDMIVYVWIDAQGRAEQVFIGGS